MYNEILKFWFEDIDPKMWWTVDSDFDQEIKNRFFGVVKEAARGELYRWRQDPRGRLAEIIVLDQFSRNIFRNSAEAFSHDPIALILAQEAVGANIPNLLSKSECGFLLLPYMHSESLKIHESAENLFYKWANKYSYEYELKHKEIIVRFGRYPHRNEMLGRESTLDEIEFLKGPDSRF